MLKALRSYGWPIVVGILLAAVVVTVWTGIQYLVDAKKLKG